MDLWVNLRQFYGFLLLITGIYNVKAWTYHYNIDTDVVWTEARQWCQKHFTDMVAIQNQAEIAHLNQILPFHSAYYWIGIRKIDDHWTWVGTKKHLVPEAANWARNEPNNQGTGEDCVEIYIKRQKDTAKWNDERCNKKKAALCYLASCSDKSCSEHAECVETIGSYKCQCDPGFMGPRCEEVVQCSPVKNPQQGFVKCDGVFGTFHFNSSCHFQCAAGFKLEGEQRLSCLASGQWDNALPVCQAVQCLPIIDAPGGWSMNCTHPLSINGFNSSCEFKCEEGFELQGSNTTSCDHTGHWTHKTPTCTAVQCLPIIDAPGGWSMNCTHPLSINGFNSSCEFKCEEGFELQGSNTTSCDHTGHWTHKTPTCTVIRCDALESFQHGTVQCQDRLQKFSYGSLCWLECGAGFTLNGSNSTYCTSQGKWSQDLPVCQAQQCSPLMDPSHGTVTCTHPHGPFSFGTVCEVSCQSGFKLHGTPRMECMEMGKWTDTPPFCLAVRCEPLSFSQLPELGPPPSMNCFHPHGNFSFGSQCFFQCAKSHELNGTSQLICSSKGFWTNSPPSCVVKEMSVSAGMLMFTAVGVASSTGVLLLGGLMFLLIRQFTKNSKKMDNPVPLLNYERSVI